jgi:hypothetical protein
VGFPDAAPALSRERSSRQPLGFGGFEMERQMLRLTLLLGVLVTILGGTGVFAVFNDQASGGANSVTSDSLAHAADLQIATASRSQSGDGIDCSGTFDENTTTPQFTIGRFQAESQGETAFVCLRNVGSAELDLSARATELVDLDIACTGDEAAAGDTTCGDNQAGELAPIVAVSVVRADCGTDNTLGGVGMVLAQWPQGSSLGSGIALRPGETGCIRMTISYFGLNESDIQQAQSDRVTWKFTFTGTAS